MSPDGRKLVLHVITGLGDGGAEAVLYRLVTGDKEHLHQVISLAGEMKYGPLLRQAGIEVLAMEMSPSRPSPIKFARLVKHIRAAQPDIVQTWMYHADLLGGLAARISGVSTVVWGNHNSIVSRKSTKPYTRVIVRLNALLSHWVPKRIVSCSEKGAAVHKALGYAAGKIVVVRNGYDVSVFLPDPLARWQVREEFSINEDASLFGCVARDDPYKDHRTLLAGFALVAKSIPEARIILVGNGMTDENQRILHLLTEAGVEGRVLLAGRRDDIPRIMSAIDVHVLSSTAEAFPNVLSEAMACGTPCAATDVGDCAIIVGETGEICPPSDPVALSHAMLKAMARSKTEPGLAAACRARVLEHFSIEEMVGGYAGVWSRAAS